MAAQSMVLRRSLYSGLWGDKDGVLKQIGGVTPEMATKLKDSGISTFADAVNSSNEDIAKAGNVTLNFAKSLRVAASKILNRTLKLSARTEENDNGDVELLVKLEQRVPGGSRELGSEKVVSYSLLIFTDRSGGLFHYSTDITMECEMRLLCPKRFGRA